MLQTNTSDSRAWIGAEMSRDNQWVWLDGSGDLDLDVFDGGNAQLVLFF